MKTFDAIVIGAGCAGLSCATALSQNGLKVLVLEKRRINGGRASSYTDPQTGEILDNGQHLLLGCYEETLKFLDRIGQTDFLPFYAGLETTMMGPKGEKSLLRTFPLPAPFHLLLGLLRYDALSWKDRFSIICAAAKMRREDPELKNISCSDWLNRLNQSKATREKFWDLVILATLNISPGLAPANLLQVVMKKGFMASRKASRVGLSRVGLSDLYATPSVKYLEQKGSEVRNHKTVDEILCNEHGVSGVKTSDGEIIETKYVICTVPPSALSKIKIDHSEVALQWAKTEKLKSSPIVSFHFWSDVKPQDDMYVGFWGTHFHWAFQKSKVYRDEMTKHWTLVASGAEALLEKSKDKLIELATRELSALPSFKSSKISHAKIVFEREATWIPPLGDDSGRLPTRTPVKGLLMAGDWTDTGLPCTIESAVLSGHKAAEACLQK